MRRAFAILVITVLLGCGGQDPEVRGVPIGVDPAGQGEAISDAARAQLDSGNVAYRGADYTGALRHYRVARELAPDALAPWYGIGMAAGALGDSVLVDSAALRIQAVSPEASGAHPEPTPGGHPPIGR